jgi:hypothetical protein
MFALQYQDGFLDLAEGENPLTSWVSTAFNSSDDLLGSGNPVPFELADTANNHRLLNFANQLAARLSREDIEVTIWLFGMPWKRCTFSFNLKNGRISGYCKIDNGEFARLIKEKELPVVFVITKNGSFVDHDWIFVGNTNPETIAAITDSLTPGARPFTFYPFINTTLFGAYSGADGLQQWVQPIVINRWHAGGFLSGTTEAEVLKDHWYCPALYLTWVIKKVCTYLGYEAIGDFLESAFIKSLVIDNNSVYDMTDVFSEFGWKIAPARHLPKMKVTDFFKWLREEFKIIYYFNSDTKQASFMLSDTVLSSPDRIDIDGCIEKGRPTTEKVAETGFELVQGIDSDDEYFKILPYTKSFFIGGDRAQKKVELPISTCFMNKEANPDQPVAANWRIPFKKQRGNAYSNRALDSEAHNPTDYGRNGFSLRLLAYKGMVNDSAGNPYPYACSDGLGIDGVTVIGDSLWLGGDRGILEKYHRSWYTFFIRTEKVELRAYLPNLVLARMSPLKKLRFATDEGVQLEALMDQLEFVPVKERLLKCDLNVYPNYNLAAADIGTNSDFSAGEIINVNTVYVKLIETNYEYAYRRPFLGARTLYWISADIVAQFFSDINGTIPVVVNGLVLNVITEQVRNGSFTSFTNQYTCYGDTHVVIASAQMFYHKGSEQKSQKFVLADGDGYFKII